MPDEAALIGALLTMHVAGMVLGMGAAAVADLLGLGILIGKVRVPPRVFASLHHTITVALVALVFSGGGLIALRSGAWCDLDSANIARVGPICVPNKIVVKLVLMTALVGVALAVDAYLLPLSRRQKRPLLSHLGILEIIRLSFIGTASLTCWCSLAAIPLFKVLHSWPVIDMLGRCALIWIVLAMIASATLLATRSLLDGASPAAIGAQPKGARGEPHIWAFSGAPAERLKARVASPLPAARAASHARSDVEPVTLNEAISACRQAILGITAVSFAINVLMLAGPLYMLQIYDRVLTGRNIETLIVLTALLIGFYAFMGFLDVIRGRVLGRVALRLDRLLGPRLFTCVVAGPAAKATGVTQQPLRDMEQIRQFVSGATPTALFDLPWTPLYVVLIFLLHPLLGVVAMIGAGVLVALSISTQIMTRQPLTRAADEVAKTHALVDAGRRNSETLRAMAMVENHRNRWLNEHRTALSRQLEAGDIAGSFTVATKVGRLLLQSLILGTGALLALYEAMSPGAMIAASIIATRALAPIEQLIANWRGIVAVWGAFQRCAVSLGNSEPVHPHLALPDPAGYLEVNRLYVSVPGRADPVLKGLNFALEPGDALAVIGPSAAGKSTLARALVGVCAARHGEIRLDGATLPQWDPKYLGKHVGYLPQDVTLFDGTIAENIARLDPSPNTQAVLAAAIAANVHETILRLEQGYQTQVGEGGAALSGGQRQRIGLARALYGNPALIVLDEPNANLDAAGEAALAAAIERARGARRTLIVIAHRQSLLVVVNRLLVLNEGRQVAFGETSEILRKVRRTNHMESRNAGNTANGGARAS